MKTTKISKYGTSVQDLIENYFLPWESDACRSICQVNFEIDLSVKNIYQVGSLNIYFIVITIYF
jgi:hypothetical protein